jgi:hypothetical protein
LLKVSAYATDYPGVRRLHLPLLLGATLAGLALTGGLLRPAPAEAATPTVTISDVLDCTDFSSGLPNYDCPSATSDDMVGLIATSSSGKPLTCTQAIVSYWWTDPAGGNPPVKRNLTPISGVPGGFYFDVNAIGGYFQQSDMTRLKVSCTIRAYVVVRAWKTGKVSKLGTKTSARSWSAYSLIGSCNTGGNGFGGLISTCLEGSATLHYALTLPIGRTFTRMTHSVSAGITPCRNTSWQTTHSRRAYRLSFHHGSAANWSQCVVNSVALHYKWLGSGHAWKTIGVTGIWMP